MYPEREAQEDLYRSYYSLSVGSAGAGIEAASLFVKAYLLPILKGLEGDPILELGAGSGAALAALEKNGFRKVRGVDISPSQIEAARRACVKVEEMDGEAALRACETQSMAAIIALDVLEHLAVDEQLRWVHLIYERLRPGGVFLFRSPNGAGLFGGTIRYGDITHKGAFTERSAIQLLSLAGFNQIRVIPSRPIGHGVLSSIRALAWMLIEGTLRVANAVESGQAEGCFTRNLISVGYKCTSSNNHGGF